MVSIYLHDLITNNIVNWTIYGVMLKPSDSNLRAITFAGDCITFNHVSHRN